MLSTRNASGKNHPPKQTTNTLLQNLFSSDLKSANDYNNLLNSLKNLQSHRWPHSNLYYVEGIGLYHLLPLILSSVVNTEVVFQGPAQDHIAVDTGKIRPKGLVRACRHSSDSNPALRVPLSRSVLGKYLAKNTNKNRGRSAE